LIREEYDRNPYLARQIAGDAGAALPSELFFLYSRAGQLNKSGFADGEAAVCDYLFQKNRIFSRMNLTDEEFGIYTQYEDSLQADVAAPGIVIFLWDRVENCLSRIARRGRAFERTITAAWLEKLSRGYEELLAEWHDGRVIRLDCGRYDVRSEETAKNLVGEILELSSRGGLRNEIEIPETSKH
jgi:deoxyguanosine kinase